MRQGKLLRLAILFLMSGLIIGCVPTTSVLPSTATSTSAPLTTEQVPAPLPPALKNPSASRVTLVPTATPFAATAATSQSTSIPYPPQPTPDHPFAGGTVSDGPFTFTLFLYKDDALSPTTTVGPWAYSDLPGVGVYMDWVYHGSLLQGPIDWLCGIEPDLSASCGGWYDHLQNGYHGGRAGGGILLPDGYLPGSRHAGDVVRWMIKVRTPQGSYGAALRFVLRQGPNGFEPTDISVEESIR